jgi:hypothetical protein
MVGTMALFVEEVVGEEARFVEEDDMVEVRSM